MGFIERGYHTKKQKEGIKGKFNILENVTTPFYRRELVKKIHFLGEFLLSPWGYQADSSKCLVQDPMLDY